MKQHKVPGIVAAAALAAVLGISACGGNSGSGSAENAGNVSPTAAAGQSMRGVPIFHPSSTRARTSDSVVLTSPAHVTKVTDFYVRELHARGWQTVSKSVTPYNGDLTVEKSGQGATVSVAPSGSGSVTSISTYRTR
jgi:hypothetical protein